ncbi:MAG: hypothetical protein DWQ35_10030 [Planctomycetota bacterium]|nr:MAG: hypothetical protein DWQ35_10030 [Planctomycetota bacterium]
MRAVRPRPSWLQGHLFAMETNQILLVVAILAAVLFLVSVGLSYKSWQWFTITLLVMVFGAAVTHLVLAAYVLKTQESWREIIYGVRRPDQEKRSRGLKQHTADLQLATRELQFGKRENGVTTREGILQAEQRLRGLLVDRGSRWANCEPASRGDDGTVELKVPNPEGRQLRQDMLVFAFAQPAAPEDGEEEPKLALEYMGEFRISQIAIGEDADAAEGGAQFTTATLVPSLPLFDEEIQRISDSSDQWTIYDKMPVDSHYLFADVEDRQRWLPDSSLSEFEKDLQPAEEGDPSDRIEVLVRFRDDYTATIQLAETNEDGDPRTVEIEFRDGEEAWVRKDTITLGDQQILGADDLEAQGIVRVKSRVRSNFDSGIKLPGYPAPEAIDDVRQVAVAARYVRPLRDFRTLFRSVRGRRMQQEIEVDAIKLQTKQLEEDLADGKTALAAAEAAVARLKADSANLLREEQALSAHLAGLDQQHEQLLARRQALLESNARLADEFAQRQQRAAREIDRRAPAD